MCITRSRSGARFLIIASAAASALALAAPVQAINITLNYQAATSVPPATDPGGTQLQAIMAHVRAYFNDVFEDNHNITINYRWGTQPSGTLAAHTLNSQGGTPHRQTQGTIVFSNTVNWFYDPTPADNSEFNMTQTLWRDLTATQRTNFYNAGTQIPQTFEVGFTGTNNGTNPNVAGRTDLVSVAFHEVGHALGMSAANTATQNQTADGDYDFNSNFVFGRTLAARTASATNIAHLAASPAVMFPSIGTGIRRLPSHTDLFSMASGHSYLLLDVPRREFYGGTNWNANGNWSGNQIPASNDDVFVRRSGPNGETRTAGLTANGFVRHLDISEGSSVRTNGFVLNVFGTATISDAGSNLIADAGGQVSGGVMNVSNAGRIQLNGGTVSGSTINNDAQIFGNGTVRVSNTLVNNGTIVSNGGTLTLTRSGSGSINLDGIVQFPANEFGAVNVMAANSNVIVDSLLTDVFNGRIDVGPGNRIQFNFPWTNATGGSGTIIIGSTGRIFLNGGATSGTAASVTGAALTNSGIISVGTGNYGRITAPTTLTADSSVTANGTLHFDQVTYQGGNHTGSGRLIWDDNVFVTGNTTINTAQLDLDGFIPLATLNISSGATLTINSTITDPPSGTIIINGQMLVNSGPSWTNDTGTVIMNTGVLGGSSAFNNQARLTVNAGVSTFLAASNFTASSQNVINGTLRLNAPATISGGSWSGSGTLVFDDHAHTFAANTTIGVANVDLDGLQFAAGSVTVNPDVLVTLNTNITDILDAVINLNSGSMTFNVGSPVQNRGTINLNQTGSIPRISGQPIELLTTGRVNATGSGQLFSGLRFSSGTVNVAAGGVLTVSNQFTGLAGSTLNKTGDGALTIFGAQSHAPGARLHIQGGMVTLQTDAGAGGQNLRIDHNGASLNFATSQRLTELNVGTGAFATVTATGNTSVLRVNSYLIAGLSTPAATINLVDETMIIDYSAVSPIGQLTADVTAGYNNGNWTGTGIRSNFAAANPSQFAIGIAEATDIGSPAIFAGQAIDTTTLIARFTRVGDANLDRVVNIADFSILGANFNQPGRWATGDFNFDNIVNIADFSLLAANFNLGVAAEAGDAMGGSPVPEPSTAAALALLAGGLLRRRRMSEHVCFKRRRGD